MNEAQAFVEADQTLNVVIQHINDDQWEFEVPKWILTSSNENRNLKAIVNSLAYEDAWVPDMLAGKTMAEAGSENFKGDLLKDDPKTNFAQFAATAQATAQTITNFERPVHTSFGDFSMHDFFVQSNGFRGLRTLEIAKLIGSDVKLSDELVQALWDELEPVADEWRQWGVFPAVVQVADDAPLLDRLLGLVGRDPTIFN